MIFLKMSRCDQLPTSEGRMVYQTTGRKRMAEKSIKMLNRKKEKEKEMLNRSHQKTDSHEALEISCRSVQAQFIKGSLYLRSTLQSETQTPFCFMFFHVLPLAPGTKWATWQMLSKYLLMLSLRRASDSRQQATPFCTEQLTRNYSNFPMNLPGKIWGNSR